MVGELFSEAFHMAHKNFENGGHCLEFGVSIGNTFVWQADQIATKYSNSHLMGFDSWKGLPIETKGVWYPNRHKAGAFAYPKQLVQTRLKVIGIEDNDSRFKLVDGFFSDSLTNDLRKEINNLIFVNIDVDIHSSTIELLDFCKPLLQKGTILYWDDWLDPQDESKEHGAWGEHLAWAEWSKINPEIITETLKTNEWNQRIMVVE